MTIKIFADRIEDCHRILAPKGVDLKHLLLSDDKNSMSSMTNKFCATTAIEIALMDVIKALNIVPDGIVGHSFGEIAAAYADECLTAEEALLVTYYRGVVTESDKKIPRGLMAVVGMSWNETKKILPKGVHVVCNNGKDTVVVSGLEKEVKELIETLNKKGVFVRELQSHGIPYHSEYLMTSANKLTEELRKCVPNPKPRSKKFVSTALMDSDVDDCLLTASAEYFVHNLISPVYFYNKIKNLPSDAIVLEVGPHGLFSKVVNETLESGTYLSLMKKDSNDSNLDMILGSISKLYELGLNPEIENLYPKVEFPVKRGTQSLSSLVRWDHSASHSVRQYPDYHFRPTASDLNEYVNLTQVIKSFLPEHCIDGNVLYPATGYLMLAWRRMASSYAKRWNEVPVIFEDVQFRRAIFLSDTEETKIKVKYHEQTGDFAILEGGNLTCVGRVRTTDDYCLSLQNLIVEENAEKKDFEITLNKNDIYKDLKILGYDYGPKFRRLETMKTNTFETIHGEVQWDGNWVTFMDSLLQIMALALPFRKMMVPVMIRSLRCDPKTLYEALTANRLSEQKEIDESETNIAVLANKGLIEKDNVEQTEVNDVFMSQNIDYVEEMFGREFHIYESVLPYYVDMNSRMIVTHGVEIEDLMAFPIPRKNNFQDLKLESYEFISNEDLNAIEGLDKNAINEYVKVCSSIANKIRAKLGLVGGKGDVNEELIDRYLNDMKDNQILLKILNQLYNGCCDENQNIDTNKFLNEILDKPEYDLSLDMINQVSKNERLIRTLVDIVTESHVPRKEIRVLEINTTRGLLAEEVDSFLATAAIYPIDVNYVLAVKSNENIPEDIKKKSFKVIEWKTDSSVFPSEVTSTDLIVYKDSYDLWSLDVEQQVQETYDALVNKGYLISVFRYQLTEPELALNQMNGKKNLKTSDLEQRIANYVNAAKNAGFTVIGRKSDTIGSMAFLFRKVIAKPNNPKKENIIEIKANSMKWFEILKEKMIEIKENEDSKSNLWVVANDSPKNGIIGMINCLRVEPGGDAIRCLYDCDQLTKFPINFDQKPFSDILENDLPINIMKNGKLGTFRHLTLPKNFDKTESNEFFLNIGQIRDLSGLQWYDLTNLDPPKVTYSFNNEIVKTIKCFPYCAGLNFRDVMLATGRIAPGPQSLFTDCLLGFEFAGRRSDTGERVMGFDMSRCFSTTIEAKEHMITRIPDHWTMDEAVTIICTYSTVWYGLIERAHMKKGDKILIHSAAGGVGQSAISICQFYGCDIYVTVGTDDKKKFLMEKFKIPEDRIFSSRNIQFKYRIKELTKGKGVDLVLNSLTGDKLDASYECVADCGRFVEIGKYDLQMNKQLGMFSFLKDISFIGVSVDQQLYSNIAFAKRFFDWVHENATNGMIRPVTRNLFRAEDVEKAFRYMTTGKHIGKIIIKIRDEENQKVLKNISPVNKMTVTTKTYFSPNKVYIITGGLGGFGMEFIHWMLFFGARKFVLTSRYGVRNDYQKLILERLCSLGKRFKHFEPEVVVSTHDSLTIEGTEKVIKDAQKLGPIGGVFHLALVLNDCLLENHEYDKFVETIDSKTRAFENLDKLSRELNLDLDHFVVFSSVACGKGNVGQSNYAYGNSVCERICEARHRDGLKGLAIQWGPIGDVGVLAESDLNTSLAAIVKQRVHSCLEIMDKLLQTKKPIVSCVIRAKRTVLSGTKESKLVGQLWQALGIDPKTTPNHLTLGEIGMESMFAVELQQGLEREYDIKVTLQDIKNITIGMMKDFESGKVDEMRRFADEIKDCRSKLSKIKFIIPNETHTRINNVKTGKPVYFLPPLEGIFASLEGLAEKMKRPVIGLNWTKDMEGMNSLKEISNYYINLMKKLEPNGNYDIVGHFYGALITMKMIKKAPVGKAVVIDMLSEVKVEEDMVSDEYLIDLIMKFISKDLPYVVREKMKRDLATKPDIASKLSKISDELREFVGKGLVARDLEEILMSSFKRAKLFTTYRLNMKKKFKQMKFNVGKKYMEMSGKLLIIKPFEVKENETVEDVTEQIKSAYFLPEKGMEGKLNFETVEAKNIEDQNSNDIFDAIAVNLNKYLS